ncbi:MAG: EamA family transporter RarD, partial [Eikenella corrodens]
MNTTHSTEYRRGLYCVIGCYLIWGFFPLYWLPLVGQPISAGQLMAHRIVWASLLAIGTVACSPSARTQLVQAVKSRQTLTAFAICSTLLATNWLLYLAAITQRQVLQASLGYFIAPLASIFCGRLFLREALRPLQIGAILLAIVGVVWLSAWGGQMPWIALGLGVSWSIYGLLRKLAPLPALPGFTLETLMLLPFALLYLGWHYR